MEEVVGLLCFLFVGVPIVLTVLYWIVAGWFCIGYSVKEVLSPKDHNHDGNEDRGEDEDWGENEEEDGK